MSYESTKFRIKANKTKLAKENLPFSLFLEKGKTVIRQVW